MNNDGEFSKERIENFSKMTNEVCEIIIKPEVHPWDSIGVLMQSMVVISAASGIPLDDFIEHVRETLSNPVAIEERNRIEAEYKKEYAKAKNHLAVAPK